MSPPRILVIDDEDSILEFVKMALEFEGYAVDVAATGTEGLHAYRTLPPALVVLDWMLPDLDGLEVCRRIRALSNTPVLMLTARTEVEDRVLGLNSGADDYLCKPFKMKELQARVRALLRRVGGSLGTTLTFADVVLDSAARSVRKGTDQVELTASEFGLLELFLRNPRRVLTREALVEHLWGWDHGGSANALEAHVSALRGKLGDDRRELIRTVRGLGYSLGG